VGRRARADVQWGTAPAKPLLATDQVHVWRAALNQPAPVVAELGRLLTAQETERAARFHSDTHRSHFIVGRGRLRQILARYLDLPPAQIEIGYGVYGKPLLQPGVYGADVRFNLSHSGELALYVLTCGRDVGIDIERVNPAAADEATVKRFFSTHEQAKLCALPKEVWTAAFFRCWTRKEAYLKGKGAGLATPLDQFDVSLAPHEPAALIAHRGNPQEPSRWQLRDLAAGDGYAAALAVEGGGWELRCWQFPDDQ
jgi:4'-phosphopantetheinyl transferase